MGWFISRLIGNSISLGGAWALSSNSFFWRSLKRHDFKHRAVVDSRTVYPLREAFTTISGRRIGAKNDKQVLA